MIGHEFETIKLFRSNLLASASLPAHSVMLDVCPCIILICGCTGKVHRVRKPPPELQRILDHASTFYCVNCRTVREAACYKHRTWYTFFCIPIFPFQSGHCYLGCVACRSPVQPGTTTNLCPNCGHWVEDQQRFCSNCGELNRHPVQYSTAMGENAKTY